jgi:hypothetical protein
MFEGDMRHVEVQFDARAWCDEGVDLLRFDHQLHEAEDITDTKLCVNLSVFGPTDLIYRSAPEVALRYQRLRPVHNKFSRGALFAEIRTRHRDLHPLHKPLVRADYEHALDVWQWLVRLSPDASLALQAAALFHDVERLQSEADTRVEQHAADYHAFKSEHARRGAALLREVLSGLSLPETCAERIASLVARHEQPGEDRELSLLNDADALSFFSLNSPGFLRYYGPAHTERKVRYTLDRMSPRARAWLARMRLEKGIHDLLTGQRM